MKSTELLVEEFLKNHDIMEMKTSIYSMALRDAAENPGIHKDTDVNEHVIELMAFLDRLMKAN